MARWPLLARIHLDTYFRTVALRAGDQLALPGEHVVVLLEGCVEAVRQPFGGGAPGRARRAREAHVSALLSGKGSGEGAREPPRHCFQTVTVRAVAREGASACESLAFECFRFNWGPACTNALRLGLETRRGGSQRS